MNGPWLALGYIAMWEMLSSTDDTSHCHFHQHPAMIYE